jgi:hypothetical protein
MSHGSTINGIKLQGLQGLHSDYDLTLRLGRHSWTLLRPIAIGLFGSSIGQERENRMNGLTDLSFRNGIWNTYEALPAP